MNRLRTIAGLAGAVLVILSSGAHSLLGWPGLRGELEKAGASKDLVQGAGMGWHFAGLAMLAFGVIALSAFVRLLRGRPAELFPVAVSAAMYLVFGAGVLAIAGLQPFFLLVFVLPGVLLAVGSIGRGQNQTR